MVVARDRYLADVVDLVLGETPSGAGVGEPRVGDQHGEGLGHPAVEVLPGVDGLDPVNLPRVVDVDVGDAGMGVGAAHEGGGEGAGAEVVEEAPVAREQARVLAALHALAELPGAHADPSRRISAARQTALTMFW